MELSYKQLYSAIKSNYGWKEKTFHKYVTEVLGKSENDIFSDDDYTNIIQNYYTSKGYNGHGKKGLTDCKWR